jgi:hypothetical protein
VPVAVAAATPAWLEQGSTLAVLALYGLAFAQYIHLSAADLGRHIRNGEIILARLAVPTTNEYSYTAPDFPFLNHHWASGVLFHLVHRLGGFPALSVLGVVVAVLTCWLFYSVARRESRWEIAAATALVMLPAIASRTEIRPEMFSYLGGGIFVAILWRWRRGAVSWRALAVLPVVEVLWVNLHLYFILGPILIGVFLVEALILRVRGLAAPAPMPLVWSGAATGLATLLNPAGLRGALYPFTVLENYGYDVLENQPFLVLERLMAFAPALYFKIAFALFVASWLWVFLRGRQRGEEPSIALLLLSLFVGAAAWRAVRNFTLFGWIALPTMAINLRHLPEPAWLARRRTVLAPVLLCGLAGVLVALHVPYWRERAADTGLGVRPGNLAALDFYRSAGLRGPIFNNFDVGSYLIYGLYPAERVFVDNRPEAYPAAFFQDEVRPLQRDEARWREAEERYGFNVIFFSHREHALGKEFLLRRVADPAWAVVFIDESNIILAKRNEQNREVIQRYEVDPQ